MADLLVSRNAFLQKKPMESESMEAIKKKLDEGKDHHFKMFKGLLQISFQYFKSLLQLRFFWNLFCSVMVQQVWVLLAESMETW